MLIVVPVAVFAVSMLLLLVTRCSTHTLGAAAAAAGLTYLHIQWAFSHLCIWVEHWEHYATNMKGLIYEDTGEEILHVHT